MENDTGVGMDLPARDCHKRLQRNRPYRLTLIDPGGTEHRVLIADCGGADGGAEWMTANNIVAELDWDLWQELTARYGRPLRIALR